jgi:hypothetical protein
MRSTEILNELIDLRASMRKYCPEDSTPMIEVSRLISEINDNIRREEEAAERADYLADLADILPQLKHVGF